MSTFDKSDFQRFAVSSIGALALSAACVIGAVGPAKAATINAPLTVAEWQSTVSHRVEAVGEARTVYQPSQLTKSEVAVHLTADGDFAGATIAKSSGNREVDARAVKVASRIAYPALPEGYRGTPVTVTMKLYFGNGAKAAADYAALRRRAADSIQIARADDGNGTRIAAR